MFGLSGHKNPGSYHQALAWMICKGPGIKPLFPHCNELKVLENPGSSLLLKISPRNNVHNQNKQEIKKRLIFKTLYIKNVSEKYKHCTTRQNSQFNYIFYIPIFSYKIHMMYNSGSGNPSMRPSIASPRWNKKKIWIKWIIRVTYKRNTDKTDFNTENRLDLVERWGRGGNVTFLYFDDTC